MLISSGQCSAATNHLITNAVFNISSDLIILSIPMPLLFGVRLPKKNKAILVTVFMIGAFTYVLACNSRGTSLTSTSIVAAVLNKYYSFSNPFGEQWTIWYLRESYTALLCANLPLIYPLIQRVFNLRNWSSGNYDTVTDYRITHAADSMQHSRPSRVHRAPHGAVRRTESREIMGYGLDDEDSGEPQFITSAIGMEGLRSPSKGSSEGKERADQNHAI